MTTRNNRSLVAIDKLWNKYRIRADEWKKKLLLQDNKCAICRKPFSITNKPYVDHCHTTKIFRGLLCRKCNLGLGHFDTTKILRNAWLYLEYIDYERQTGYDNTTHPTI